MTKTEDKRVAKEEELEKSNNDPKFDNQGLPSTKKQAELQEEQYTGDSNVNIRTQDEVEANQKKADKETSKVTKEQTNRGLRNDTRPGGGDGNGKTYKDERIQPSDTNAPDAGLLPDGTRIAI